MAASNNELSPAAETEAETKTETAGPGRSPDPFELGRFEAIAALRDRHRTGYFCPICATVSERFLVGGVGTKRPNAKCPNCGSLERHRLFWLHFVNEVWPHLPPGKKDLLHVAPEPFFAGLLKPHAELNYLSGDLMMSDAMLKVDLTDMRFHDRQLDVIICSHVLEHIPDDRKAMAEMHRVLRPGGFLLVMVPTYGKTTYENWDVTEPQDRVLHFGQDDHVRKYGKDIVLRLEDAGFSVTKWPTAGSLDARITDFVACGARLLFACRKDV
jgi:SAM-dependent methyltransferase